MDEVAPTQTESFVAAGGEMGARIRAFDWSSTLGSLASWPQSLKTCVRIMLTSRQPMFVWWGKDLINLYNDPYRAIAGGKHPEGLGQPAAVVWREIWDQVYPRAHAVLQRNEGTYDEALLLIMERNGYPEETYYTFSYSPVPGDDGSTAGILGANTDDTQRIVGQRRLDLLRALATSTLEARSWQEACQRSASAFAINARDLPFGLIYVAERAGAFRLVAASGFEPGQTTSLEAADSPWPLAECAHGGEVLICDLARHTDSLPRGDWDRAPAHAALVPIPIAGSDGPHAVLVVGLNPYRLFDESYRSFLKLAAGQIGASITSASAYEQERRRAEALAEIDRAKTAFFSNVSHEFRTPLTLIVGPAEDAINHGLGPPELELERWRVVQRNSLRLLKLVNTLLDFSRIEADRAQAAFVPTDLTHLTRELASAFRSAFDRAGLRFAVDCAPLPQPVYVDHDMYEKIVLNLLSNALKFTFAGEVSVELRSLPQAAELTVRDTGTGIPAAELPHLFERFHRVQGARSRTHEGSGIGLALVSEVVRLHGGQIAVESQLERGTTFTIVLPYGVAHLPSERVHAGRTAAPSAGGTAPYVQEALRWLPRPADELLRESVIPRPASDATLAPALGATSSARIVLADDNADMREYVTRLLRAHWDVEAVADGAQALAAIERRMPELLLTDVMMPNLDGFELLRALRENPRTRHLPVIMLSARAGEESRIEGLQASADDYLIKPFSARELLARVATHIALGRVRNEVRHAHERLRTLFEQAPVAVSVSRGPDFVYELTNARYEQALGRSGLVGKSAREAFPELASDSAIFSILRGVRERGEAFHVSEYKIALRNAEGRLADRYFMCSLEPIREADGSVDAIMSVAIDVTEQVRMRSEIVALSHERESLLAQEQKLRAAAEAANRSKDEFLAMLGHELRNPLAPILTALHLMRLRQPELAQTERTVIERQVDHLVRLVDDLLDIARITGGKIEIKPSTVELSELVAKAIEVASPLLEQRRHTLHVEVETAGLQIDVDPIRITQVISNLLINAAKYTEAGGRIDVTARRDGAAVVLTVSDTGQGISAEMLPHVFEPFVQESQASNRPQGGLGLGLAIVSSLVRLHGGSVSADSAGLGLGSRFSVRLPRSAATEAGAAKRTPSLAPMTSARKLRVLIVDDNADAAEMLSEVVMTFGYEVRVAHDGPEALAVVGEFEPHVALLDIGLPVMDGYELARRLREQRGLSDIRLFAATGYGQDHDRTRSQEAGFDLHFVKPLDLQQLAKALDAVPLS